VLYASCRSSSGLGKARRLSLQLGDEGIVPLNGFVSQSWPGVWCTGKDRRLRNVETALLAWKLARGLVANSALICARSWGLVDDHTGLLCRADRAIVCMVAGRVIGARARLTI
jgi:hypothetical protein